MQLLIKDETYNNKQVSKVFRQNFSWNMPKTGLYFGSKSQKSSTAGGFDLRPPFRLNT